MKLSIENKSLKKVIEFLDVLELKGKSSRARVKLSTKLNGKLQDFSNDFIPLNTKFNEIKEEIKQLEQEEKYELLDDKYTALKDTADEMNELSVEISVVGMTEYEHLLPHLKDELDNYQGSLQGDRAIAHDVILDALEENLPSSEVAEEHSVEQSNVEVDHADYEEAQYEEVKQIQEDE